MSEECLRMLAPIILQKLFITNVLQGMFSHFHSWFTLFLSCDVSYIYDFRCRLEAHFQSKVQAGLQSGSKIQ